MNDYKKKAILKIFIFGYNIFLPYFNMRFDKIICLS